MNITINKGTSDVIIDINDLIKLLNSNVETRKSTIAYLKKYVPSIADHDQYMGYRFHDDENRNIY